MTNKIKYNKDHQYIKCNKDGVEYISSCDGDITVGITYYAQGALGDIVYVELPKVGEEFKMGSIFGTVESVKAANDLYMPVDAKVIEVNGALADTPGLVNSEPYGAGWLMKIKITDSRQLDELMNDEAYNEFVEASTH